MPIGNGEVWIGSKCHLIPRCLLSDDDDVDADGLDGENHHELIEGINLHTSEVELSLLLDTDKLSGSAVNQSTLGWLSLDIAINESESQSETYDLEIRF